MSENFDGFLETNHHDLFDILWIITDKEFELGCPPPNDDYLIVMEEIESQNPDEILDSSFYKEIVSLGAKFGLLTTLQPTHWKDQFIQK